MNSFEPQFSEIKGVSQKRRMPRLGKIRLGIKVKNQGADPAKCECRGIGCFRCTHPAETPYFVCPPEVIKVYGQKPTVLDIMFPVNNRAVVFPQALKYYGSSRGLKCIGNGESAVRFSDDKKSQEEIECPCELLEQKKCSKKGTLQFLLPKISLAGVYQIDLGSFNSIVDCNSGIDYIAAFIEAALGIKGRFAWIPALLKREPIETHHEGKKQTHFSLHIYPNISIDDMNILKSDTRVLTSPEYQLPPPENIRPDLDGVEIKDEADLKKEGIESQEIPNTEPVIQVEDSTGQKPPAPIRAWQELKLELQDMVKTRKLRAVEFSKIFAGLDGFETDEQKAAYLQGKLDAIETSKTKE